VVGGGVEVLLMDGLMGATPDRNVSPHRHSGHIFVLFSAYSWLRITFRFLTFKHVRVLDGRGVSGRLAQRTLQTE